ncbi:hypothetical protein [Agriterribacter sp.]|uniref:hypothetical protein n=1 Tax=Agriterribacter sp. TaxID=2821509 RepID=UPI002B74D3C0|nr:hypothetical protein [Agriterribacter sp.]HRO45262.1 hypothetical protein [Agriterribacter sp.]HRQ16865.1 hypothetical protein [Agriterribacter sp.]
MLTEHKYQKLADTWDAKIKACCDKEDPDDPRGCDCCYDSWQDELKVVKTKYSESEEKARQLKDELTIVADRRDKLKMWYDELTKANDLARKICDQLEILLTQVEKISTNTGLAVQAIKTLYCMVRDFYMQVDLIKTKYDRLQNCIKCLNNPALGPGVGIMKCLEEYGKKLEIVIATRDEVIKMLMAAIKIACRINKNISVDFGLSTVITEWSTAFNCSVQCDDDAAPCPPAGAKANMTKTGTAPAQEDSCLGACSLEPILLFPVCKDPYYKCVDDQYETDKKAAEDLAKELLKENKKKEALLACKQSLESAIKETDPKSRCK